MRGLTGLASTRDLGWRGLPQQAGQVAGAGGRGWVSHEQSRTDDRRSRRGGGGITGQRQRSGQHGCCGGVAGQSPSGAPPSRCPASPRSTGAGTLRSTRCRAPRRATAARAGTTQTAPATPGVRGQPGRRHLGHRHRGARHRRPQPGRGRRDRLGVVRLGGQLQRGRVLRRRLRQLPGVRGQRGRRHLGHGHRGARHRRAQPGRDAQSPRCRAPRRATAARAGTTRQLRPPPGVRGQPGQRHLAHGHRGARHRGPQPGRGAEITSVSCASAGNCSAGGSYTDSSGHIQAFVVSQTNGTWRTAIEVPGTAALNQGGPLRSTRCRAPRRATAARAGSTPTAPATSRRSWSARSNGTWRTAIEVPGTAALNRGGIAEITSVSCASAGNCSAGGHYADSSGHQQAFVVSQINGTWGTRHRGARHRRPQPGRGA